jgi:hypothetical protein
MSPSRAPAPGAGTAFIACSRSAAGRPASPQVKANLAPKPAGGKGKDLLSWPFPDDSKAQWLACVDMSTDSSWLFPMDVARDLAQQKHAGGTRLLYFYTDESVGPKSLRLSNMTGHRLEAAIAKLVGGQARQLPDKSDNHTTNWTSVFRANARLRIGLTRRGSPRAPLPEIRRDSL